MSLNPYMGWAGGPEDAEAGAVLVFARTAREARPIVFDLVSGWCAEITWLDVRVKRLRTHRDYLMTLADADKLHKELAHGMDDVPTCPSCETWGAPVMGGRCSNCDWG